jgi:hypothetical protein
MKSATKVVLLLVIAITMVPWHSRAQNTRETEFRTFYSEFLSAVRANDKNKIADLVAFPVEDWSIEHKGNLKQLALRIKANFWRNSICCSHLPCDRTP